MRSKSYGIFSNGTRCASVDSKVYLANMSNGAAFFGMLRSLSPCAWTWDLYRNRRQSFEGYWNMITRGCITLHNFQWWRIIWSFGVQRWFRPARRDVLKVRWFEMIEYWTSIVWEWTWSCSDIPIDFYVGLLPEDLPARNLQQNLNIILCYTQRLILLPSER